MDDVRAHFLPLDALRRRRSAKWRAYDPDVLPLWVAEMDVAPAPPIAGALSAAIALGDTGYAHVDGLTETYTAFSARRYGWAPAPERVSVVPDVMNGIAAVLRLATAPGDGVVITPPVYPPFRSFIEHVGRHAVDVPLRDAAAGFDLDLDGLGRAFDAGARALLLCNPHNPTGRTWDRTTLTAVADLADRHGVLVVSDEVHAPLTYDGTPHIPFGSVERDAAERAVTFVAASKAWNLPALKAALALAGPQAAPELQRLPRPVQMSAGLLGTIAAQVAFDEGGPWLASLLDQLDDNRRTLATLLDAHLPAARYRMPEATYLAWIDCRDLPLGDDPAAAFLERGRVALSAGPTFGEGGRGFVRLNLATDPDLLAEAVRRMGVVAAS